MSTISLVRKKHGTTTTQLKINADAKLDCRYFKDSAAQIVETIWPPPKFIGCSAAPKDKVLPLRTFIQETLRRSRTSYSTLQVALYYLIVIRPHLPPRDCDINSMPPDEAQMTRAKQCGRRMFLAALILASKYLQDRNYSARAWSKISGLNTQEINVNEMAFLDAVNWKLHISETNFQKWTDLVLKYTSDHTPSPVSPIRASPWMDEEERKKEWCELILTLTPDLIEIELTPSGGSKSCSAEALAPPLDIDLLDRATSTQSQMPAVKPNTTQLAPPVSLPPRTLEPQLRNCHAFSALHQPLPKTALSIPPPSFRRSGSSIQLSSGHNTPAVGLGSGNDLPMSTPITGSAMATVAHVAHNNMISGCAQENWSFISRRGSDSAPSVLAASPSSQGRRSSLSLCMMRPTSPASSSLSPGTQFSRSSSICPISSRKSPMFPFKRQNSDLSRLAISNGSGIFQTPTASTPSTFVPSVNTFSMKASSPGHLNKYRHMVPCASPKSREAALSLNMLKENYSPCSTGSTTPTSFPSLSRKRSYVASTLEPSGPSSVLRMEVSTNVYSVDGHTSVTPKFKSLTGFGSPTLSPNLDRSKRLRCAVVGGKIGMMEGMSVPQNVR